MPYALGILIISLACLAFGLIMAIIIIHWRHERQRRAERIKENETEGIVEIKITPHRTLY